MQINLKPVAFVKNSRTEVIDDHWGGIISEIELADHIPAAALEGISGYSHLEIIFFFDKLKKEELIFARRPRGNPDYPMTGIFAQRAKVRPNSLGLCTVELIEHKGRILIVKNLDAINGTPVLDIKPVVKEFQPKGDIRQPGWVSDLMKHYWK
ncbi:MAG TPA: tRNA (N6-threonylcarbamoyladenosine(37)-N6)-methyltransferase TrmO [Bacteroidia bacterium]